MRRFIDSLNKPVTGAQFLAFVLTYSLVGGILDGISARREGN